MKTVKIPPSAYTSSMGVNQRLKADLHFLCGFKGIGLNKAKAIIAYSGSVSELAKPYTSFLEKGTCPGISAKEGQRIAQLVRRNIKTYTRTP